VSTVDGRLGRAPEGVDARGRELLGRVVGLGQRPLAGRADRDRVQPVGDQRGLIAEPARDRQPRELRERRRALASRLRLGRHRELGGAREPHRAARAPARAGDHVRGAGFGGARLGDHDHRLDRVALRQSLEQLAGAGGARRGAAGRGEDEGLLVSGQPERVREFEQDPGRRSARGCARSVGRVAPGEDDDRAGGITGQGEQHVAQRDVDALVAGFELLLGDRSGGDLGEPVED